MSVTFDVSSLKDFKDQLKGFGGIVDSIIVEALNDCVAREIRMTKKLTPRDTKTLMNNWRITDVKKDGDTYQVTLYNNTDYADYVEFGHRTRDHKNWVPGKFMLTISERQIEAVIESIVDRHLEEAFSKL